MYIGIDTHTHTIVSGHAYCTLKEMAQAAAEKKLEGLAITEHAPNMPGSCHMFYFQNLRVVPRTMYGITLLLGTELNILSSKGEVDMSEEVLKQMDIAIASMHTPCMNGDGIEEITKGYLNVMNNPYVDIVGHPDDARFPVDYEKLVKSAKETGTLLEVNNSSLRPGGFRKDTKKNVKYMLELCKRYEAMIVLGSDAHVDVDIAGYHNTNEVLQMMNFPEELIANTSLKKLQASLKRNKTKDKV